jgi:hypothetical protein
MYLQHAVPTLPLQELLNPCQGAGHTTGTGAAAANKRPAADSAQPLPNKRAAVGSPRSAGPVAAGVHVLDLSSPPPAAQPAAPPSTGTGGTPAGIPAPQHGQPAVATPGALPPIDIATGNTNIASIYQQPATHLFPTCRQGSVLSNEH